MRLKSLILPALAVVLLVVSNAHPLFADYESLSVVAPEIDPGFIGASLGLLGASVLVLRARRRPK